MSLLRFATTTLIATILAWLCKLYVQEPVYSLEKVRFISSKNYQSTPYKFETSKDGAMVRFEVKGYMRDNTWSSFEFEVFGTKETYLFTYHDELWTETGRDSDGAWRESRNHLYFDIRLPEAGEYHAVLHTSKGPVPRARATENHFNFRVYEINGNKEWLNITMWLLGILCFGAFLISDYLGKREPSSRYLHEFIQKRSKNEFMPIAWLLALYVFVLSALTAMACHDDDLLIDYRGKSASNKNLKVDRQLREHSMSSAGYRTRSGLGGK
ncbi:hypothetical protein N474_17835 [Pseudoalteromonas luteoviolacea CPMOR-2]|uniref:hypothetical protein n=1 Tax=Pseudoalteromonas luteoviolacea TaxID=43657 RepID=UPI0007B070E0|nr:hypothetical protein [Pseudoalteromonas luteoviolacea]KZN54665.1 hypothetical protein N474_17835 [Pseudoalteromonas luteoviolacea CPMOR-2]MBE0386144.1 hypothetical protein [Pseudoalteromonas luteoviolacea DSM 6061]